MQHAYFRRSPRFYRRLLALLLGASALLLTGYYPQTAPERPPFNGDGTMLGLDYDTRSLTELIGGKKTVIFYFLPTCPHCQAAAPRIAELARTLQKQIQFIGVSSGSARLSQTRDFKARFQLPFLVVQDSGGTFGERNNLRSYPAFILTDGSPTPPLTFASAPPGLEKMLEVAILRFIGTDPMSVLREDRFYGAAVCSTCHIEEYRSWSLNHHSVAIRGLVRTKKDADPECVGCHVVGYGQAVGFKDLERTPELADVGCEACHGMAGGHSLRQARMPSVLEGSPVERYQGVCLGCHDTTHALAFDTAKGLPLVGHHQDRTISEVDWLVKRTALLRGETDRPLLTFPPGKSQGAQSCKSCHKAIYDGWLSGPHTGARITLEKKSKAKDINCIRCHATPKEDQEKGTLEAFLPGGVQCESCHGPGEAHVKSGGGKGNIVALTDSCPTCVLEALCTSCHTGKQDSDFDLDRALEATKQTHTGKTD